ncbi:MAG: alanine--tRNA ligase [Coriobacteriia bacterium]|nr:alanine--tRNA ligase [Coriobacteriia bacterium]
MTKPLTTAEIRESFLAFFENKGSKRLPSASLIPNDPSLLLTAAGMVPFKPIFLGVKQPEVPRATTAQKCVRTTDIDIIGSTGRHLSFFEMLGSFSFGDYFKREAIAWSWEYSTEVLGLDPDRLWATVYRDDDEAAQLWEEETPLTAERIKRFDEADNFWAAGPTGPCGPCSELFYDRGADFACDEPDCSVGCECDRYVEYWNLVFMQYNRDEHGTLTPLPNQSIDTGMGLERMAAIMQDVASNFDIDLMRQLVALAEKITNTSYTGSFDADANTDTALRIISDHARSVAFLIADGVLPSNEGRGYVLRRLLRRAVRYGRLLGVSDPFMQQMTDKVIDLMGEHYQELLAHRELIAGIVAAEEERFLQTLRTGLSYLADALAALPQGGELSGAAAFELHDTYGFPVDLTLEIAAEGGYSVDSDSFEQHMDQQKERARGSVQDVSWSSFGGTHADIVQEFGATYFEGYNTYELDAVVLAIVDQDGKRVKKLKKDQQGELILNYSPFYGEQGGQAGDTGSISAAGASNGKGAYFQVTDTRIKDGLIIHAGTVQRGSIAASESVTAAIDLKRRNLIRRNHTATHLLHWALRKVVGTHVTQAGSFVGDTRLRFDFTHFERLTAQQLAEIERLLNEKIADDLPVRAFETTYTESRELGVMALFGEKYDEYVRVLEIGNTSKELCGGTHVGRSSEIGLFKITNEESVGANMRRIEAVTSIAAYDYVTTLQEELLAVATTLKASPRDVHAKVTTLLESSKKLKAQLKEGGAAASKMDTETLLDRAVVTKTSDGSYKTVIASPENVTAGDLRQVWDSVRQAGADACILLTADCATKKTIYLAAATDAATNAGFHAGQQVQQIAAATAGRGGGKPAMAQGGADELEPARLQEILAEVRAHCMAGS